jgi:hypothetical protein
MGYGLSGAVLRPAGDPLVVAKFRGEIWNPQDWSFYLAIRNVIFSKPVFSIGDGTFAAAAMGIDHPELRALGVTSVVNKTISAAVQEDGGLWIVHHEFLQYRPPQKAPARPKFVVPDIAPPTPTPRNALEIEQDKLNAAIDAKFAQLKK